MADSKEQSRCPICSAPTAPATRPFCSKRCADVDLLRWLRGGYAIAGQPDDDEDGADTDTERFDETVPRRRPS